MGEVGNAKMPSGFSGKKLGSCLWKKYANSCSTAAYLHHQKNITSCLKCETLTVSAFILLVFAPLHRIIGSHVRRFLRLRWLHSFFYTCNHKNHFLNKSTLNVSGKVYSESRQEQLCCRCLTHDGVLQLPDIRPNRTLTVVCAVSSCALTSVISNDTGTNFLFLVAFAKTLHTRSLWVHCSVDINMQCALVKGEPNTNVMLLFFNVTWLIDLFFFPLANESEMTTGSE